MIIEIILLVIGLILLIKGANWLVEGASSLAKKYNVSDLVIGLTIVAFGTSAPELVVNSVAALESHTGLVYGNVVGSNNFNLFFVLGVVGIISPLVVKSETVWKEIPLSLLAVIVLFILSNDFFSNSSKYLSRLDGVVLLVMFVFFIIYVFNQLKGDKKNTNIDAVEKSIGKIILLVCLGLIFLITGGKFLVDNAVEIAKTIGVSEKIVGLTVLAIGTSLPEFATSVVAAVKKNNDIAVGNIIGSNIFNIFLIMGFSAVVHPIKFEAVFNNDMYILAAGTIFLFIAMFTGIKKRLDRWEAILLFTFFLAYSGYLIRLEFLR